MPSRFHIAMHVTDLPAAIAFYAAMFDAEPIRDGDAFAKFVLDDPAINLALSPGVGAAVGRGAVDHTGFQVQTVAEIDAYRTRWEAAGLPITVGESVHGRYKVWVHDPDGNEWEIFTQ